MVQIKDFDEAARERHAENAARFGEHPFQFRGEVFFVRANVDYDILRSIAKLTEETDGSKVIDTIENAVVKLIDPKDDAHNRFRAVRQNDEMVVTYDDLTELLNWLIEEQTKRPPTQAESSSGGDSTNGTTSTGPSSTVQAVA